MRITFRVGFAVLLATMLLAFPSTEGTGLHVHQQTMLL